jgi:O-antigen ligase
MTTNLHDYSAPAIMRGGNQSPVARLGPLTINGIIAFLSGIAVFGSGFGSLRPTIGGLLLHPCMIPLLVSLPVTVYLRIGKFPPRILSGLAVFTAMYCISALGQTIALGEIAKSISAAVMIVGTALLIRTRTDFVAGTLGFTIAIGLLAFRTLQAPDVGDVINPIDVANKNSFSIYALPAILLAGAVALQLPKLSWLIKGPLVLLGLVAAVSILTSGNRSGWLGVVVVGVLLVKDRKMGGALLVLVLAAAASYWITNFGDTRVAEQRIKDTEKGRTSDNLRLWLFRTSFAIALENPLVGVSPQQLPFELGRRVTTSTRFNFVDPHNVFGHVVGGSGLICFAALLYTGWAMWKWPLPKTARKEPTGRMFWASIRTMHSMLILWMVRGMFTREILYNPGACIGLGLVIGWCMVEQAMFLKTTESDRGSRSVNGVSPPVWTLGIPGSTS